MLILNVEQTILLWKLSHHLFLHWTVNTVSSILICAWRQQQTLNSFSILFLFSSCLLLFYTSAMRALCRHWQQAWALEVGISQRPRTRYLVHHLNSLQKFVFPTSVSCLFIFRLHFLYLIFLHCSLFVINPDWTLPHFPILHKPFSSFTIQLKYHSLTLPASHNLFPTFRQQFRQVQGLVFCFDPCDH